MWSSNQRIKEYFSVRIDLVNNLYKSVSPDLFPLLIFTKPKTMFEVEFTNIYR